MLSRARARARASLVLPALCCSDLSPLARWRRGETERAIEGGRRVRREIERSEGAGENARGLNKSVPLVVGNLVRGTRGMREYRTERERVRNVCFQRVRVRNKNIF